MKTRILIFIAVVLPMASFAAPHELKKLLEIIASNPSDKPLHKQLLLFPNSKKYSITTELVGFNGKKIPSNFEATEKHVEGLYIVSESAPKGPESKSFMIVEFDDSDQIYRKYLISGGKISDIHVGTRIGDSRVITWHDLTPDPKKPGLTQMILEEHTDTESSWKSVYLRDGKLVMIETGTATPIK